MHWAVLLQPSNTNYCPQDVKYISKTNSPCVTWTNQEEMWFNKTLLQYRQKTIWCYTLLNSITYLVIIYVLQRWQWICITSGLGDEQLLAPRELTG